MPAPLRPDGQLVPHLMSMMVNATTGLTPIQAAPFWDEVSRAGIRQRRQPRNEPLGVTLTRPDPRFAVFAAAYADHGAGGQNDEDYLVVDLRSHEIAHLRPRPFFERFPEYGAGSAHHGDRSYLAAEDEDPTA